MLRNTYKTECEFPYYVNLLSNLDMPVRLGVSALQRVTLVRPHFSDSAASRGRSAMHQSISAGCSIPDFCQHYGDYLFRVRGLSGFHSKLHRHVICRLLTLRFPDGKVIVSDLRFKDLVDFLGGEFARLERETQRAWANDSEKFSPVSFRRAGDSQSWEGSLTGKSPITATPSLPKNLSPGRLKALRAACRGEKPRHFRNRLCCFCFCDLDFACRKWQSGPRTTSTGNTATLKVRCTKTYNDRILTSSARCRRALIGSSTSVPVCILTILSH